MEKEFINLVSSDEEENDNGLQKPCSKPIIITTKKSPPKQNQVQNKLADHKLSDKKLAPKIGQTTVLRLPPYNNNHNKNVTVIYGGHKPQMLIPPPNAQSKEKKPIDGHKAGNVLSTSSITITPIKDGVNVQKPSSKLSSAINMKQIPVKPKTDAVAMIPKITNTMTISSLKDAAPIDPLMVARPAKRIRPAKISDVVTIRASSIEKSSDSDMMSRDSSSIAHDETVPLNIANGTKQATDSNNVSPAKRAKIDNNNQNEKTPIHEDYKTLLDACKAADKNANVDQVILKLKKYYYQAHPDYVNSKSFCKLVKKVTDEIHAHPSLLYVKIKSLLDELKQRRTASTDETSDSTAPKDPKECKKEEKLARQIQKLSNTLRKLQKMIRKLDEKEVDWDEENNTSYLVGERLKKKATEVYEKLCDLTGESRNAERIVKKPIKFQGTKFPEFNRKLEKFVNDTKAFPDMFDVLRILDHCNQNYNYRLKKELRQSIAQNAFTKIGNLLQERRKRDFYEMVQYHTSMNSERDPAGEDPMLRMKLEENQKHSNKRLDEVIEKYTMRQSGETTEDEEHSPAKRGRKESNTGTSQAITSPPTTSTHVTAQITITPPPTPAAPQEPSLLMKMDTDLEIVDADLDLIISDNIINDEDMAEIENEIGKDLLLPQITSVKSLHPGIELFDPFDTGAMESSGSIL